MEHTAQTNDWSQCSPTATFTMGGYEPMLVRLNSTYMDGALRVVLSYNPADRGSWQSIETLTALLGIYPKAEKMYIEAP